MIAAVIVVAVLVVLGLVGWGLYAAVTDAFRQAAIVPDDPAAAPPSRRAARRQPSSAPAPAVRRAWVVAGDDLIAGAQALDETEQRRFDAIVSRLTQ